MATNLRQYINNFATTLDGAVLVGDTTITLTDGSDLPVITGSEFYLLTFSDVATGNDIEIVKVTARTGNDITVIRAQENTLAFAYADLDLVRMNATADSWNIQAEGDQTVNVADSPTFVDVTIDSISATVVKDHLYRNLRTGLIDGGILTIGTDTAKFDLAAGNGIHVDDYTDPLNPVITEVSWNAFDEVTVTNIATQGGTFIGINSSGSIVQQALFDNTDLRDFIQIGSLFHPDFATIVIVDSIPMSSRQLGSELQDLCMAVGFINITGNNYSANGANVNIDKTGGSTFGCSINWLNSEKIPNTTTDSSGTGIFFFGQHRDGSGGYTSIGFTDTIDTNFYDDGSGTLAALANNKYVVHRISHFPGSGGTSFEYGQDFYASLAEAEAAIPTQAFDSDIGITSLSTLRAFLIVKKGSTDLSNTAEAKFLGGPKTRLATGSAGGSSTANHGELAGLTDDDHLQYSLISSQAGAPSSTPGRVGEVNVDLTSDDVYVATDTISSGDWTQVNNSGGSGATTELDNLGTVAINASLISDTDSTYDLGSTGIRWANLWVDDITVTTNITVGGTVDGRDVATDGTKLDGLENAVVNEQTTGYTAVEADRGNVIRFTGAGGVTLDLTAAATLTDGWFTILRNDSSGQITIDPASTELINGTSQVNISASQGVIIYTNGTLFYTVGILERSIQVADIAQGTDGELQTWDTNGTATTVPVGTATHVLTSNGAGAEPTFQTLPTSSTTVSGVVELATTAEVSTGTDTGRVITPSSLPLQIQNSKYVFAADGEASDTYVITLTPAPSGYVTGQVFYFSANTANTGTSTLNVNTLGAKAIMKNHDVELASGDIESGSLVCVIYDGTQFQMLSQIANIAAGGGDHVITTGSNAPVSTPANIGDHYIDTNNNTHWFAHGTSSASDWRQVEQTSALASGTGFLVVTSASFPATYTQRSFSNDDGGISISNVDGVAGAPVWNLSFQNLTTQASIDHSADWIPYHDTSAGGARKIQVEDLISCTLLETITASSVATVEFTTGIDASYTKYVIVISKFVPVTDAVDLLMRISDDGGVSWEAGTTDYAWQTTTKTCAVTPVVSDDGDGNHSSLIITGTTNAVGSDVNEQGSLEITVFNPSATGHLEIRWEGVYESSAGTKIYVSGGGTHDGTTLATDGFQFLFDSGNIESAVFKLYAYR